MTVSCPSKGWTVHLLPHLFVAALQLSCSSTAKPVTGRPHAEGLCTVERHSSEAPEKPRESPVARDGDVRVRSFPHDVRPGDDVALEWEPLGRENIGITLAQVLGSLTIIACSVKDTGRFVIGGELTRAFTYPGRGELRFYPPGPKPSITTRTFELTPTE